jgi:hypothetical protein
MLSTEAAFVYRNTPSINTMPHFAADSIHRDCIPLTEHTSATFFRPFETSSRSRPLTDNDKQERKKGNLLLY